MDHLTALLQEMWRQGEVPHDFKDETIVHLYKRKGNRHMCDNHRGISLLNIAGKVFTRILLIRLDNHLKQGLLPESQCGFRRHHGTMDMIFAARPLQEKCQEMRTHLYSTFVDLTKAFDTVNREGLWKIMKEFGCPERFIEMLRQLHDGMMARVTNNRAVSEAFVVTKGVKHGCVLAPTLFSLMFSAMLMDAYRDQVKFNKQGYRQGIRPETGAVKPRPSEYTDEYRRALETDENRGQPAANANPGDRVLGLNVNRREHSVRTHNRDKDPQSDVNTGNDNHRPHGYGQVWTGQEGETRDRRTTDNEDKSNDRGHPDAAPSPCPIKDEEEPMPP
ncbi:hypothetical protein SprV_0301317000 [Sparganum proliferum]